jgi:hypothetical protein
VSIVLSSSAVTLARNGAAVGAIDLGFAVEGVTSVNVRGAQDDLRRPVAIALADDPRVAEVAVSSGNPLFNTARRVAAAPSGGSAAIWTPSTFASPEFFSILRIPIDRGRASATRRPHGGEGGDCQRVDGERDVAGPGSDRADDPDRAA